MRNRNAFSGALKVPFMDICCWPDCEDVAGEELPLCGTHAAAVWWSEQQWRMRLAPDVLQPVVVTNAKPNIVYYVKLPGDMIKIGTTSNLAQRLRSLRVDSDAVLATEPGDRQLEAMRHAQFKSCRIGTRENFKPTEELLSHIDMIARHAESPQLTG